MGLLDILKKRAENKKDEKPSQEVIDTNQKEVALHMKTAFDKAILESAKGGKQLVTSAGENGKQWTIFIKNLADAIRPGSGIIFQIDVNLANKGKELHCYETYSEDTYSPIEGAGNFTASVIEKMKKYLQPEQTI